MSIDETTLFSELFNYYRQLQSRRWQYYATLLVVDGLLLNAWDDVSSSIGGESILLCLCVGAVFIFIASFRLLSRVRYRINATAIRLNTLAGESILDTGSLGWLSVRGNTIWLYVSVFVLSVPWLIGLWGLSRIVASVMILIYLCSFCFVRWSLPGWSQQRGNSQENDKEKTQTDGR